MKTTIAFLVLAFSQLSFAIDFPTGNFECIRKGQGAELERRAFSISKTDVGGLQLPVIKYQSQFTDSSGHAYPFSLQEGLASTTLGSNITTLRLSTNAAIAFNEKGEPTLPECKKVTTADAR